MRARTPARLALSGLAVLFLVHNDLWLWDDGRILLGLPVGLLYHVVFCLLAAVVMLALVRYAWPAHLEVEEPPRERG